jgi:transcriptional regulator with XRE-family HTH domain
MPLRPDRLKQRRQQKGFNQADFARAMSVSQQQIARWEGGQNDPTGDALARMAKALDCTVDWLLGLVAQPHAHQPPRELTADEHQLLELYRQGRLPDMISRLVNELAGTQSKESLVVDRDD